MTVDVFLAESTRITDEVLADARERLDDAGLIATKDVSKTQGTAELSVYFNRGTSVVDAIQTELVRDGEALGTPEEVRDWLNDGIDQVLADLDSTG
jgi:hypothetical protein